MPFKEESWSLFDRSPKHPQFRIGDYVSIEKESTRRLAYITGMNAPSLTGAPWRFDIQTLDGKFHRLTDSDLHRFSYRDASLADVIRVGIFSSFRGPLSWQELQSQDTETVEFFVRLCAHVGEYLATYPDRVERNIPKVRLSLPREKEVLALSRFLAEYGLNYFDCFRKDQEKHQLDSKLPIFGAVYPALGGSKVQVTRIEFASTFALTKEPMTTLRRIDVTFFDLNSGCFYKQDAQTFFDKCVRNEPELMELKAEAHIVKIPAVQEYTPPSKVWVNHRVKVPNWLNIKQTYLSTNKRSKYYVLNFEAPDDEFQMDRVIYQFIGKTGGLGTVHSSSVKQFCEMVLPEPIEDPQQYKVLPVDTQPFEFSEDVVAGNLYKASCENQPVVIEKVFFELETSRWFALCRYLSDSAPERMRLISVKALLQVGSNGKRHWTRMAKNLIEYFKNNRSVPDESTE